MTEGNPRKSLDNKCMKCYIPDARGFWDSYVPARFCRGTMTKGKLEINREQLDGLTILEMMGALDVSNAHLFDRVLLKAAQGNNPRILIDCKDLNYVNSTSFGVFFKYHREVSRKQGALGMCSVQPKLEKLMKVLGLDKYLALYPDRETAIKEMNPNRTESHG